MENQLCVLIVDDESELLEAMAETCSHLGYTVLRAANATEALTLLNDHDVDVVLTDVRMRPICGFELLEKARDQYPRVPFVMWTGFWEKSQEEKVKGYEGVVTMTKPFSLTQVKEVLEQHRSQKSPAPHLPLKGEARSAV